eukprot:TRINITY_DN42071_c0_g1_i1.p1 TRINITY_DN42071_c0_g1~~TRINITY_DN42071_c0_g1_i1.p1  ORF type:complete len:311 (-),score=91.08 TRINITY_DN42071_c0_g1_i1:145-1077(-)
MKIKRQKNHRRILRWYRMHFAVQDPFRVLVDGPFLTHALQQKVHVKEQLPKILEGRTTPCVTNCVCAELRSLGERALGASLIAKGYYRIKCGHMEPVAASECIREQIGKTNSRKFFVATQDQELNRQLRKIPGVPLLRLDGPVPRLEDPSYSSREVRDAAEAKKARASDWEKHKLPELRAKEAEAKAKAEAPPKKRKGPKGANPLSCRKKGKAKAKKSSSAAGGSSTATGSAGPAAAASANAEVTKPKRQRSRKMGTRPAGQVPETAAAAGEAAVPERATASAMPVAAAEAGERPRKRQRSRHTPNSGGA